MHRRFSGEKLKCSPFLPNLLGWLPVWVHAVITELCIRLEASTLSIRISMLNHCLGDVGTLAHVPINALYVELLVKLPWKHPIKFVKPGYATHLGKRVT